MRLKVVDASIIELASDRVGVGMSQKSTCVVVLSICLAIIMLFVFERAKPTAEPQSKHVVAKKKQDFFNKLAADARVREPAATMMKFYKQGNFLEFVHQLKVPRDKEVALVLRSYLLAKIMNAIDSDFDIRDEMSPPIEENMSYIKVLLKDGDTNVNQGFNYMNPAITAAVKTHHLPLIKLMFEHGGSNTTNSYSPIEVISSDLNVLESFADSDTLDNAEAILAFLITQPGVSPYLAYAAAVVAVRLRNFELIQKMHSMGYLSLPQKVLNVLLVYSSLKQGDFRDWEPYVEIVDLLLKQGASPNFINTKTDEHVIATAAREGSFDVVERLLRDPEVDVGGVDMKGRSLLYWASKSDRMQIVNDLLKRDNFAIDAITDEGNTALHYLVMYDRLKQVDDFLFISQRNINHKNNLGLSALDIAKKNNSAGMVSILKSYGAADTKLDGEFNKRLLGNEKNVNEALDDAVFDEDVLRAWGLLKQGADPNFIDEDNYHLLFKAVDDSYSLTWLLLTHGADPKKAGVYAKLQYPLPIYYLLLRHGAVICKLKKFDNDSYMYDCD